MDLNRETILDELNGFEKKRSSEIPALLEEYLIAIAKTGDIMFPWNKLKPLVRKKSELVMNEFYESCPTDNLMALPNVETFKYDVLKEKILDAIDAFPSAPFTIQRICELLTNPRRHYKRTDKFMRGLEKVCKKSVNILVVSTIEPHVPIQAENNNISVMVNGVLENATHNMDSSESCNTVETSGTNTTTHLESFTSVFPSSPSISLGHVDVNESPVLDGLKVKDDDDSLDPEIQNDVDAAIVDSTHECACMHHPQETQQPLQQEHQDMGCESENLNRTEQSEVISGKDDDMDASSLINSENGVEVLPETQIVEPMKLTTDLTENLDSPDCSTLDGLPVVPREEKPEQEDAGNITSIVQNELAMTQPPESASSTETLSENPEEVSSGICERQEMEEAETCENSSVPSEDAEASLCQGNEAEAKEFTTYSSPEPETESLPNLQDTEAVADNLASMVYEESSKGDFPTSPDEGSSEANITSSSTKDMDGEAGDSIISSASKEELEPVVSVTDKMDTEPSSTEDISETVMEAVYEEETKKAVEGIEAAIEKTDIDLEEKQVEKSEPMEQD